MTNPVTAARECAHDMLTRAGFVLKYVSESTSSRYYALPDRTGGRLRLSDHASVHAREMMAGLILNGYSMPKDLEKAVGQAVGLYVLRTRLIKPGRRGPVEVGT